MLTHVNLTTYKMSIVVIIVFFFQAEDGIRDLVRSRGLGDVYKRQMPKKSMMKKKPMIFGTNLQRTIYMVLK